MRISDWSSDVCSSDLIAANADFTSAHVVDFLLRDPANPSSILSIVKQARDNARTARTYLTREVWEAVNTGWMTLVALLKRPVREDDLPDVLATIRRQNGQVRGALTGTMLRDRKSTRLNSSH